MHQLHCRPPAVPKAHPIPSNPYKSRVKGRKLILSPNGGRDVVGDGSRRRKDERGLAIVVRELFRQTDETESGRLSRRPKYVGDADSQRTAGPNCFG